MPKPTGEPLLHTYHTDCLPEEHPWAHKTVSCGFCGDMVHAFNNETMTDWVEWGGLVLCLYQCFIPLISNGDGVDWEAFSRKATYQPEDRRGAHES